MPQLIAIALVGGAAWLAWRALRKEMARVGEELHEAERVRNDSPTRLERGPDGVWRPKDGE